MRNVAARIVNLYGPFFHRRFPVRQTILEV
jgi:hypothetical protein